MSTQFIKSTRTIELVESYTCDGCKKVIPSDDWMEVQEMLHWRMTGGFGSIFGDGASLSLDLCQECTKARLGDVIQRGEDDY